MVDINVSLVARLIAQQFPEWAHLPIRPVAHSGWDNRTFHLGSDMTVRLPSHAAYAAQVDKEQRWLPILAPLLPVAIPMPLARGEPSEEYPWAWSVYRWIDGENAVIQPIPDPNALAHQLAAFLTALQHIPAGGGPDPGPHNFYRGGSVRIYDFETRTALETLRGQMDTEAARMIWETAVKTVYQGSPVWIHGDVHPTNLLVRNGQLGAVIDFGCLGIGDPACDLVMAWTFFSEESRQGFRSALALDDSTWARARGWALWKALITLADCQAQTPSKLLEARRTIAALLTDHT